MKTFAMRRDIASASRWLAVFVCLFGCSPRDPAATTWLSAPSSLALAGRQFDKMFVANAGTDAVQVLALSSRLAEIDFVASPARYFPLSIPAGPHPELLAATADGGFVMVVDTITSTVRLIDAETLKLVRDETGAPQALPLGPRESQPIALMGWQGTCSSAADGPESACLGRAYALLRHPGLVVAIDVRQTATGAPQLQVQQAVAIGGAPLDMAVHPSEPTVFVTDALAPRLTRVAVGDASTTGTQSVALGVPGGAVAVSHDGSLLAVARPSAQDLIFFTSDSGDVAQGTLRGADADPVWTPSPACLAACDQQEPDACQGAHPADLALCATPDGYRNTTQPYAALYVGAVPRAILAMGGAVHGGPMVERCDSGPQAGEATTFSRSFAIATLDGALLFAGVPDGAASPLPRLIERTHCQSPQLRNTGQNEVPTADVLAPCGELPASRARMECLLDPNQQTTGVALMRGFGNNLSFGLQWEGVIPGGDRSSGGGDIDAEGRFIDVSSSEALVSLDIVPDTEQHGLGSPGDILEILTEPRRDAACQEVLRGQTELCALERRIVAVAPDQGGALTLDQPLPRVCFERGGAIAYRIRASHGFFAGPLDDTGEFMQTPVRLRPGDTYGPGRVAGALAPVFFSIAADLDTGAGQSSCTLYRAHGEPAFGMPSWRSRRQAITWRVLEPFAPVRAGMAYDYTGLTQGNLGRMPSGLAMTRPGPHEAARLIMAYSGSDALLITSPLDSANLAPGVALERLLR